MLTLPIAQSHWDWTPTCAPLLPTSRDIVVAMTEEEAAGMSDDNDDNNNDGNDNDDDEDNNAAVATDMEDNERHCRQPIYTIINLSSQWW